MNRDAMVNRIEDSSFEWDVIVVGGGATGLGTAVDAAARGYRTLLLEQSDFAKGTSSRSTKLIHGGIRYLRQGNISLVMDSLRERGLLMKNAPHLVHPLSFVVPVYKWSESLFYTMGLKIYDFMAGKLGLFPSRHLSREETLEQIPGIKSDGLRGGVLYYDAQFDDARLAITLAQTLVDLDGVPINYIRVVSFLKRDGRIYGVSARDLETGKEYEIHSRAVINATGVFTDTIRRMDDSSVKNILTSSQGIHLVLDKSFLPGKTAIIVPKTDDGRVLFMIPWQDRVLVGTTDTPSNNIELEPRPQEGEIIYLLEHATRYLAKKPEYKDILSVFAGLRPLIKTNENKKTSKVPRDHIVIISKSGLVTIAGGKWTTYRKMGEDVIDQAAEVVGLEKLSSRTKNLRLHGWMEHGAPSILPGNPVARWQKIYGSNTLLLQELISDDPALGELLHPNLPYLAAEIVWVVRHEMARSLEDVLARRTRALFLDTRASLEAAPQVVALIAKELQKNEVWQKEQLSAYQELARSYQC